MTPTLLTNARLIDPASGYDEKGGLLVDNGIIADLGPALFNDGLPEGAEVVDCLEQSRTARHIEMGSNFIEQQHRNAALEACE